MPQMYAANVLSWMAQAFILASLGSILPIVFRIRHPRTQLAYCHFLLAACVLLPFVQPWRHPVIVHVRNAAPTSAVEEPPAVVSHAENPVSVVVPAEVAAPPDRNARTSAPIESHRLTIWKELEESRVAIWILLGGVALRLAWLFISLWQIRRCRIGSTPIYPIPESIKAASAITHTDALFCRSADVSGPVMLGWLAPVVLLPESFEGLDEEAKCGIVCHELLHVRRHDWLITLLEELAGAAFWFNPGVWFLLSQARLAREQVVDAEVVRLTASAELYIEALLSIARTGPVFDLVPAAAPLFLRRHHLTQRMHALLRENITSRFRLLTSYGSFAVVLIAAGWFAFASFPLIGNAQVTEVAMSTPPAATPSEPLPGPAPAPVAQPIPSVPVPPPVQDLASPAQSRVMRISAAPVPGDRFELATTGVKPLESPGDRVAALGLMERAMQPAKWHMPGNPPYRLDVSFRASGKAAQTGSGELTETWLSGQSWRWTSVIGNSSIVRVAWHGRTFEERQVTEIPVRVQMMRNAIFWATGEARSNAQIRAAAVQWNGKATTCLLTSRVAGPAAQTDGRLWEEEEYCIDNDSGTLQIYSVAPGTYTVYGYSKQLQFHDRTIPDQIGIYVAGANVLDAHLNVADAGAVDPGLVTPTPAMLANPVSVTTGLPTRFPIEAPGTAGAGIQSVIVQAEVDALGHVLAAELSATSDPSLVETALDLVTKATFPPTGMQRQAYINVKFVPPSQ